MHKDHAESPEILAHIKHILVVEDHVSLRFTLAEWLRALNYVVYEAANADEAITVLSSSLVVDMVVTDVEMPGTMNGFELHNHIRNRFPALPVIVVSGNAKHPEIANEAITFYHKPYDLHAITAGIKRMLDDNLD